MSQSQLIGGRAWDAEVLGMLKRAVIAGWCSGPGLVCHIFVITDITGSAFSVRNLQRAGRKGAAIAVPWHSCM